MMTSQKFLLFVSFAVFASFHTGDALKCNFCVGSLTSDCANNVTSSFAEQTCYSPREQTGPLHSHTYLNDDDFEENAKETDEDSTESSDDHRKLDTFCIYLTTKDGKGEGLAERGCAYIYQKVDICKFIKKKFKSVKSCKACRKDNCN